MLQPHRAAPLLLVAAVLLAAPVFAQQETPQALGPDVTVITLGSTSNWGADGGIRAYSVGTTSCNVGDSPVAWCDAASCVGGTLHSNDHPVIAQNLYRLKNGRFEQIGMSWLKHGWLSTNTTNGACKTGHPACDAPPGGGDQLGVGCTDTYNSGLNGGTGNPGTCDGASGEGCRLGQRSAVDPTSGEFPMPYHDVSHLSVIDQRIQVAEVDLDPALNAGATYWIEGQYYAADDAVAGNAGNNASYRRVTVGASPFNLTLQDTTIREQSAIEAWPAADPQVERTNVDLVNHSTLERFQVARKITQTGPSSWHYEYAIRNHNSDHAAQAFAVDFPDGTSITNTGFKDIDHHSGEPYATTDWTIDVNAGTSTVTWAGETFATNENANALRFGTMFNFWFDADASSAFATNTLTLFKPATPSQIPFTLSIFSDGFESGGSANWSQTSP